MNWTGPKDLKAQLARLWERGELLRDMVNGNARFPLRLSIKPPTSNDITERFQEVRNWASALTAIAAVRVEWRELQHRVQGVQQLPAAVWVDSLEAALTWLGKRRDADSFAAQLAATRLAHTALLPWLEKRPMQALELSAEWPRLLAVVTWLVAHPRPAMYLRQVDLPGVHSKFIEAHRAVLAELLDAALPAEAVDCSKTGVNQFCARYGFLDKPLRIRFRVLDPALGLLSGLPSGLRCPDMALDAESFSQLQPAVRRVFITENETNFLAFPQVADALVIFGAGYGWEALARSRWLQHCAIYYWGDIDTHGFGILNQLRAHFAHVASFLMDRATLDAHVAVWGTEDKKPLRADLPRLTAAESQLYDELRDNRIRPLLRLEQEHVGFLWVMRGLGQLLKDGSFPRDG